MTMPAMRQAHSTVPGGLRMVALPESATDEEMARGMPGSRTFVAEPNKRLGFVRGTTKIAAFDSFLNAGTTVADEDAYKLARTLHANWKQLQKDYPPLRGTPQEGLSPATNPMPYHSGAIKYWREVGLWTADKKLSKDRADAVKAFLVSKGAPAANITVRDRGTSEPVASGDTEEGRAMNTRIEFAILE